MNAPMTLPRLGCMFLLLALTGCPAARSEPGAQAQGAASAPTPAPAGVAAPASASWAAALPRTLREEFPAVGSFRARQSTRVGAEVSGEVARVLVDVGDRVVAGQPLVELDRTFFEIEVAQRKAEVDSAKARQESAAQAIKTARAELEHARAAVGEANLLLGRMKALWEKPDGQAPSIPKSRYDAAVFGAREAAARYRSAESRVAEAQARSAEATVGVARAAQALRYSEERLAKTVIQAPFAGVISARLVDPGEPVTATPVTHLLEVQETATLYLEFSLPQELLARVREGTRVRYAAEGVEGSGEGEIAVVFPTIDETTRSFRCRVVVANASGHLRPGLLARVHVTTRAVEDALVIPRAALGAGEGGWIVRVDAGDGQVAARPVDVGLMTEREVEVLSGLTHGERVLIP